MKTVKITNDNFENEVIKSDVPVLVDFWAAWCGPCMMQSPVLDELADEYDSIKIGKINVDEEPALSSAFGIASIPTLVVMKDKKVVNSAVGFRSKEEILALLK
jgi:thioredoxin 1